MQATRHGRARSAVRAFAGLVGAGVITAGASAQAEPTHPAVVKAVAEVRQSKGALRYAALRGLWRTWDQTDPVEVEAAMRAFSNDPTIEAPARAYAGLLAGYARRRRGDLDGARAQIKAMGFVTQWLVVGPFDNEGRAGLPRAFTPESQIALPLDMLTPHEGRERPVRWRTIPDIYPFGWIDFGDLMRPREPICAYATAFVRAKGKAPAARDASVWVGAAGAFRAFWNGEEVLSDTSYREIDPDRMAATVSVMPGWNRLTLKVCGDDSGPMMSVRLGDGRGAPDATLETSADPADAQAAAANSVKAPAKPAAKPAGPLVVRAEGKNTVVLTPGAPPKRKGPVGLEGPLQTFERVMKEKSPPPELIEGYARYLQVTGGDDPTDKRTRLYAKQAAEAAPTVERALLAASVSEDRNQEREWIDKAIALSKDSNSDVELLMSQARWARRGTNWRDAVPFYDRVLKLDPDHTEATLARVDLYNEAGLRRTGLVVLEKAVERNPRAVGLLGAYAAQLAALERQTESDEVSDRYAAYRFDDASYQYAKINLAVARRDKVMAEHWIKRMLGTDPDSAQSLGVAAQAYFGLGMNDKALEMFHKALEMAPEDTEAMKALADLHGQLNHRTEQLELLRKILVLRPQNKEVREYVEHIEPPKPRTDEAYAWEPDKFLPMRTQPAGGFNQRTLHELRVTTVYPSGLASQFHQVVYQPLTDEAAANARQTSFVYQTDSEVAQVRAGRVYRADGRIDEATETGETAADNPDIAMYTSSRNVIVQFSKVNPGDVVELRYRVDDVSAQNAYADYFGEVRYMQSNEPVMHSEYVVIAPKSRPLFVEASGIPGLTREDRAAGDNNILHFNANNLAPVLPETSMPPWTEILGHVHVSTYKTWDDIARWYWGLSKDQLVPDDEVRAVVEKLTKGLTSEEDKVKAVYHYVVQRTRYVALEFGIYGFKPRRAAQTFARGWGDCKDKAALIVTMLRVAGVPAQMVMVRTGMRGDFPTTIPSLAPFDHAIAYVPSLDLYLDGTASYTGTRELPAMDRGSLAVVVSEKEAKVVRLPDPGPEQSVRSRVLDATIAANGSAQMDMKFEASGVYASQWRERYHAEPTRRDRVANDVASGFAGFELQQGPGSVEASDLENLEQPAKLHIKGRMAAFARKDGGDLSIPVTPSDRYVHSYAAMSMRKQDVKLYYRSTIDETWVMHLPAGLSVKSAPVSISKTTPFGILEMTVERKEGLVTVHTKVALGKSRIKPSEYQEFQKFCEEIDRALNQRLIIGKTK